VRWCDLTMTDRPCGPPIPKRQPETAAATCGPPIRRPGAEPQRGASVPATDAAPPCGPPIPARANAAEQVPGAQRAASATTLTRARAAKADAAAALKKMPKRSALFSKTLMQAQKTRDGRTCSWCKLVGKRNLENVTLAPCGPCLRRRGVSVLYCSRKCQREAWQTHKPICAATPWSLAQHRFHGKGQREYVRRLVQDHLIHTLAWKREPSHASTLLTGRILPYLLSYSPPPPGWSRHWSPAVRRYALSLTLVWARTLAYERESANARGVWRDHVLPFLLDASTVVPEGW
jgi:hypothetical protein